MPVVRSNPPRLLRPRRGAAVANAPYALAYAPYDPTRPAILSVAHDEADGGAIFVITDRPCYLSGSAYQLPLTIHAAGGGRLAVLSALATAVPVKYRLVLSGPVPRGAAWAWGPPAAPGAANLFAAGTVDPLNAASGDCADVPGPYAPPPPANVVSTNYGTSGSVNWATLTFDRPVILNGQPPDDAILFAGFYAATAASQSTAETIYFEVPSSLSFGSSWAITRQPAWVDSPLAWPAAGTF
jgi:hypothetical protein